MIKLQLTLKPAELDEAKEAELVAAYRESGKAVWKAPFITQALWGLTYGGKKCAYTECPLQENGSYMEVEHFYPKSIFPELVVRWGNLLPTSKTANVRKGDVNPEETSLVNPLEDEPRAHLFIKNYRYCGRSDKGKNSIEFMALNDFVQFIKPRVEVCNALLEQLNQLEQDLDNLGQNTRLIARFLARFKNLLAGVNRSAPYSAFQATVMLESPDYRALRNFCQAQNYWDEVFTAYEAELRFCALLPETA